MLANGIRYELKVTQEELFQILALLTEVSINADAFLKLTF